METLFKVFIDWIKLAVLERQDDDFNLAIIQDASTFVYLQGATPIKLAFAAPAVPGTLPAAQLIYKNSEKRPVAVFVRAANVQQTSVVLLVAKDQNGCGPTVADLALEGVTPSITLVVKPNSSVFGTVISTPASAIVANVVPLNGRGVVFPTSKLKDC